MSRSARPEELRRLLEQLGEEDCAHSWRNFGVAGTLDELQAWENELRPTDIFFFYLQRDGQMHLVGTGSVAHRLTAEFPHPGFCVLSRCYIMPEFRGLGLYRRLLHYRMEYCGTKYGDGLNGIHIGSVDDRVSRVLSDHELPGWPTYVHLGEQVLNISGSGRTVGAYMMLMPGYVQRLQSELAGAGAPDGVAQLRRALAAIDDGTPRFLGPLVQRARHAAGSDGWRFADGSEALDQLLLFCKTIPLVGLA